MKITKTKSGKYHARVELPAGPDGKRRWKSITAGTKDDVRYIAAKCRIAKEEYAPTLAEALNAYIAAKDDVLSPYTIRGYKYVAESIKRANLGKIRADMTRKDAQKLVSAFSDREVKTIKNRMALISAAVRFAGFTMPPVTYPQGIKKSYHLPTEDEVKKLVAAAKGTELEIPVALGLMGLRRGEICALSLSDLDGCALHIHKSAVDIGGKMTLKTPKTYESDRVIQIPEELAEKIRAHGCVTKLRPEQLSANYKHFLAKLDVEHFRFHDLRHFFASYCHNVLKLSDAQIQRLGGWKTDHVMKRVYIDAMRTDEAAASAAEGIGGFLA